ncbi:hypothetical protein [Vibrio sinaloensis]|uniref:hypothetical protein n=1 Tax=Photobacterium sp. (strain ATCC 43367) TaxID=379097 RepID=UPI0035E70251
MTRITTSLILFLTMFAGVPSAFAQESSLFLFALPEQRSENLHQTMQEYDLESERQTSFLDGVEYQPACEVKCGVRNTSLFLLHMVAEAKVDQEYRTSLILPNYEP